MWKKSNGKEKKKKKRKKRNYDEQNVKRIYE
jgi:hypothetical protein